MNTRHKGPHVWRHLGKFVADATPSKNPRVLFNYITRELEYCEKCFILRAKPDWRERRRP